MTIRKLPIPNHAALMDYLGSLSAGSTLPASLPTSYPCVLVEIFLDADVGNVRVESYHTIYVYHSDFDPGPL